MARFLFLARFLGMRRISRCAQDCLLCSDHHGQDRAKNQICAPANKFRSAKLMQAATDEETMQFKHVTLELDGSVAILRLDHQEVMNAVSMDMLGGLSDALDAIEEKKDEVRCVVLTGAGRAFCTGANLQGRNNQAKKTKAGLTLETGFHPFLRRIRNLHCPIVTAVNGPAAGAGMSFALLGDMILCARSSYFLQAFRRIGLVPDCGSTWLLPRLIGKARSVELSLMGERLPAEKALEWGLVNRVYDDGVLMEEAMKLARDLASGPTTALSLIRKLYWDSPENSFEDQLNLEFQCQIRAGDTQDFREGVGAFLEKRPAQFKGK
jgi:2-(1,2-epoxy-1,2-dihydrophenyl)acetyl-CoA isomerase